MKRRLSTIILSVFLAVLMGTLLPIQVFADQPTYIKELKMEYADTFQEAESALKEKGYTPIDGDFGKGGKQAVAVGYIPTDNKDEAITDVKVMEEKCGYDFAEYEKIIDEKKSQVDTLFNGLKDAIEEFKENYNNELGQAVYAYKMMNYYINDDMTVTETDEETGEETTRKMGVGEMFISDDTTDEQFKTLFLESNVKILAGIEEYLAIGCATENWVAKAPELEEASSPSAKELANAKYIYNTLSTFQKEIKIFESLPVNADSTTKEIEAFQNDETTTTENLMTFNNIYPIYNTLKETTYLEDGDQTLYDLFMSDLNSTGFVKKLVPLVNAMTPGQIATFAYIPLYQSISASLSDEDNWNDSIQLLEDEITVSGLKKVSAYDGVDRTIFTPEGIALTSAAIRERDSSNNVDIGIKGSSIGSATAATIVIAVGAILMVSGAYLMLGVKNQAVKMGTEMMTKELRRNFETSITQEQCIKQASSVLTKGCVTIIAIGAALIASYFLVTELYNYFKSPSHPKYTEMPRIMVDATTLSDDSTKYTYYYATKDLEGNLGDLNDWNGSRWIGLYYTKDTDAGKPISTDYWFEYARFSTSNVGNIVYRPVALFGENAPYNLNHNGLWDSSDGQVDKINYVYFAFVEANDSTTTASIFSNTNSVAALSAFGGLLVGAIVTMLIANKKIKKIKNQTTTSN